jgi:exodeoxyribonuclease V alpha subunit
VIDAGLLSAAAASRAPWARALVTGDVDPEALSLAVEAAGWPSPLAVAERRAFALLVLALLDARGDGATRLPLADAVGRATRLGIAADDAAGVARLVAALPRLAAGGAAESALAPLAPFLGGPGDHRPFIVDADFLYVERDLRIERRLAEALRPRVAAPPSDGAVADVPAEGRTWTAEQRAAIAAAVRQPLTVISGGPGTGKTALIAGIARAWLAAGLAPDDIAIAAPTGKAANRVGEMLAPPLPAPETLHRLLGLSSGRPSPHASEFRHHENRPVRQRAVIVDEASMVGMALMDRLLRALRADARLVLIGDADQLPAVDAGRAFADLGRLALRLTVSHRMNPADPAGAAVLEAARAIAAGALGAHGTPPLDVRHSADIPFAGFACVDPGAEEKRTLAAFLRLWFDRWLDPRRDGRATAAANERVFHRRADGQPGLEPADAAIATAILDDQRRLRLLTVTRQGPFGAEQINEAIDRAVADALGSGAVAHRPAADTFRPGTPVMMTHNDYDRALWNGDQGVVLRVASGPSSAPELAAVFPRADALIAFPLATLQGALAVAYASTVHKAQGSELDHAALLLPDRDTPLLSRELVYTAVTRVRRSITIVGARALLEAAAARPLERSSGLAERLFGAS